VTDSFGQIAEEVGGEMERITRDAKREYPPLDKENEWRSAIKEPYREVVTASAYYSSRSPVSPLDVSVSAKNRVLLHSSQLSLTHVDP
jgi:hypothetical protein